MYFKLEIFGTDFRIICKRDIDTLFSVQLTSICQLMDTMVKRKSCIPGTGGMAVALHGVSLPTK